MDAKDKIWDKINALYYTHTLGTVTKAGNKLGLSHSAISKYIKSLEEIMGVPLAHLEGKYLTLTAKGKELVDTYHPLILKHEHTFEKLSRVTDNIRGHFTISLSPLLSHMGFFEDIASFCDAHPSLSFSFQIIKESPDFTNGESDIDIRPLIQADDYNNSRYLTTYDMGLYASRAYIQKRGFPERLCDIKAHLCIALSQNQLFPYASHDWQSISVFDWQKYIIIDSYQEVFQAVENGMGIGVLPHTAMKRSRVPLLPILHESLSQSLDIYYHCPKFMSNNKVIEELYTHFKDLPESPLKGRRKR